MTPSMSLSESIRVTRAYNQNLPWRLSTLGPDDQCHYCRRKPGVTDDHIVPKALGGSDLQTNIVPACEKCNGVKADQWPTCQCNRCAIARKEFLAQRIAVSTSALLNPPIEESPMREIPMRMSDHTDRAAEVLHKAWPSPHEKGAS